jgi:hypothetical protein
VARLLKSRTSQTPKLRAASPIRVSVGVARERLARASEMEKRASDARVRQQVLRWPVKSCLERHLPILFEGGC